MKHPNKFISNLIQGIVHAKKQAIIRVYEEYTGETFNVVKAKEMGFCVVFIENKEYIYHNEKRLGEIVTSYGTSISVRFIPA